MPVERLIGQDVIGGEVEHVHRRSRVFRRKPRGAEQGGERPAAYPVFVEPVLHSVQGAHHGEVVWVQRLAEAPQRARRVGEVATLTAAVRPQQGGVAMGKTVEQEQGFRVLDRALHERPADELVDPAPLGRRLRDEVGAHARRLLDAELSQFQVLHVAQGKIYPEPLDGVVVRQLPIRLADLPGQRRGHEIVRVGQSRAAIDASRKLVEDDQFRQNALRRVPDRIVEEPLHSLAVHLVTPHALRPESVRIHGVSGERSDPPPSHRLLPVLAGSVGRRPQATEPEFQHRLRRAFRNAKVLDGAHVPGCFSLPCRSVHPMRVGEGRKARRMSRAAAQGGDVPLRGRTHGDSGGRSSFPSGLDHSGSDRGGSVPLASEQPPRRTPALELRQFVNLTYRVGRSRRFP